MANTNRESKLEAWMRYQDSVKNRNAGNTIGERWAFDAGYEYQQAKLDKLIAFIKGEITRSEIEDIL